MRGGSTVISPGKSCSLCLPCVSFVNCRQYNKGRNDMEPDCIRSLLQLIYFSLKRIKRGSKPAVTVFLVLRRYGRAGSLSKMYF